MKRLPVLALLLAGCAAVAPAPSPAPVAGPSFGVRVVGAGPPMVLIPGLACPGEVWDAAVARWSGRHRLHVITIAGFAGQPPIAAPLLETVRRDLLRYFEAERLDRPVIVGHSLGGFVAWWLAATAPDRVGPIVSIEGVPFVSDLFRPGATVETSRSHAERMRAMMAGLSRAQFAAQNRMQLATMITDPREVERIAALGGRSDPASVGEAILEMMTTDLRDAVAALRAPALLVVGGTQGPAAARAIAQRQVARVPRVQVVVVEKARHFVMLDAPGAFFTIVENFLAAGEAVAR